MDILSDVLGLLKLQGTLYFRTEFSPPWGIEVPAFENVARFHLVHRGRCWLGMTPMQYLTGWRMQVGRQLLTESDLPILDVAERSGYRSEAAFGRVFRRHFAASPARYRRSRQSEVAVGH